MELSKVMRVVSLIVVSPIFTVALVLNHTTPTASPSRTILRMNKLQA